MHTNYYPTVHAQLIFHRHLKHSTEFQINKLGAYANHDTHHSCIAIYYTVASYDALEIPCLRGTVSVRALHLCIVTLKSRCAMVLTP
jgi:hypothetical protein